MKKKNHQQMDRRLVPHFHQIDLEMVTRSSSTNLSSLPTRYVVCARVSELSSYERDVCSELVCPVFCELVHQF